MHDHAPAFPSPPQWALDLGMAGRMFVFLAIVCFALSAIGWLLTPRLPQLKTYAARSFTLGACSLFATFAALAALFINHRFEFAYVYGHSDLANTLPYRVAGIWAGQEGSFLLWACCSAVFALIAVRSTGIYRRWFTVTYAVFLGSIATILAYETPFGLNLFQGRPIVPSDGVGLSPALQNYWVTIHPPVIFLGFGCLTVLGAFAFAALATNRLSEWAPLVRPWAILSLTLVGVGLCLGGFWAYETLGWGGFWMWDPVENVSFVPWVFTGALVHGLMVQITRKRWTISNLLLGGLPFMLFVYGTFLTRSGVLNQTSVHSFAEMDSVAHRLLLGFLSLSTLTFLTLWGWRAWQFKRQGIQPDETPRGIHREAMFRFGAWMLVVLGMGTAVGMSWPMFMAMAGQAPKVVEEPLYHRTLAYIYIPLMIAMALGPLIAWRGMGAREFMKRIYGVVCITLFLVGAMMLATGRSPWTRMITPEDAVRLPFGLRLGLVPWVLFLVTLSIFVAVANAWRIAELIKRSKMSAAAFMAHMGVAVLMAGLIISRGFEQKARLQVKEGNHDVGLGYFVAYKGMTSDRFDRNNKVQFELIKGKERWIARPGFYYADTGDGEPRPMVWPHIQRHPLYDIYFAIQPEVTEATDALTLKPGEQKQLNGITITYLEPTREGQPGHTGTKFGAKLRFQSGTAVRVLNPTLEVAEHGTIPRPAELNSDLNVVLKGLDASNNTITLQILYAKPIYPVEMFYKPLTSLVWLGTGILTFAGLLSAWYRRPRRVPAETPEPVSEGKTASGPEPHPVPVRA